MAFRMPRRILVVEDTPELQELLEEVLTDSGFEVMAAFTNSEAMEMLKNFSPDLLLTDCFLDGAGPVLIQVLKKSRPDMPIVVLSGDPVAARTILPEAEVVLGKPVSLPELLQTLLRVFEAVEARRQPGTVN